MIKKLMKPLLPPSPSPDDDDEEENADDDEQCHLGIVAFLSTSKPRRRPLNPLSALYLQQ